MGLLLPIDCPACGKYEIDILLEKEYHNDIVGKRFLLSGIIREKYYQSNKQKVILNKARFQDILKYSVYPSSIEERYLKFLNFLKYVSKFPGQFVPVLPEELVALFYSVNLEEACYYVEYLSKLELISIHPVDIQGYPQYCPSNVCLTPKGWEYLEETSRIYKQYKQAFVAMAFDSQMCEVYEQAIHPAIKVCGFTPFRVDKNEHNEKICDVIMAQVRVSRFLLADITCHKKGVYFEAGFAFGLGLPVIFCCKDEEEQIKSMHFDTRQYNHVLWKDIDDYRDKLEKRIKGTIGIIDH